MTVVETENLKLKIDLQSAEASLVELRQMFLSTTTKLGTICSRLAIDARLPIDEFGPAIEARLREMREEKTVWERQAAEKASL
jgi:hypothetical protein